MMACVVDGWVRPALQPIRTAAQLIPVSYDAEVMTSLSVCVCYMQVDRLGTDPSRSHRYTAERDSLIDTKL